VSAAADATSGNFRVVGKVDGKPERTRTASVAQPALKTATPHVWLTVAR